MSWLSWVCSHTRPRDRLFALSQASLLRFFLQALAVLKLDALGFTLASIRTGGATAAFRAHQNIGALQYAGRWRSAHTLHHYLQEAMSMHAEASIPGAARALIEEARSRLPGLLHPPASLVASGG